MIHRRNLLHEYIECTQEFCHMSHQHNKHNETSIIICSEHAERTILQKAETRVLFKKCGNRHAGWYVIAAIPGFEALLIEYSVYGTSVIKFATSSADSFCNNICSRVATRDGPHKHQVGVILLKSVVECIVANVGYAIIVIINIIDFEPIIMFIFKEMIQLIRISSGCVCDFVMIFAFASQQRAFQAITIATNSSQGPPQQMRWTGIRHLLATQWWLHFVYSVPSR